MKLHLGVKATINSQQPGLPMIRVGERVVYYSSPYIYIVRIPDGLIEQRLRYEGVQAIKEHDGLLYVCTNDVYVIEMDKFEIVEVCRMSKPLIRRIVLGANKATGAKRMLISKISCEVSCYENGRRVLSLPMDEICEEMAMEGDLYGLLGKERLLVYRKEKEILNKPVDGIIGLFIEMGEVYTVSDTGVMKAWLSGQEVDLKTEVSSMAYFAGLVHTVDSLVIRSYTLDGNLKDVKDIASEMEKYSGRCNMDGIYETGKERLKKVKLADVTESLSYKLDKRINEEKLNCEDLTSEGSDNGSVNESDDEIINEGTDNGCVNNSSDNTTDESNDDSTTESDDNTSFTHMEDVSNVTSSNANYLDGCKTNTTEDYLSVTFDQSIFQLSDSTFILHDNFNIIKIFAFNTDVTDCVRIGEYILLATTEGDIRYTSLERYAKGEYLFDSKIIKCHDDAITSMAHWGNLILTGCRDGKAVLWKAYLDSTGLLALTALKQFTQAIEPISTVAIGYGIVAIASLDHILQVYSLGNITLPADTLEITHPTDFMSDIPLSTILIQQVHNKQINHILITESVLVTSSSDRSAKIFSHSGELYKTISSDKVIHASASENHIAICSHKAIKLYDSRLEPVTTFQVRKPVLSSCFYNGMLLCASDVVRVYDIEKRKCVKSYDLESSNAWSFLFPILCAENKIILFNDESEAVTAALAEELRVAAEGNALLGAYCREGEYRKALAVTIKRNDYRRMYGIVSEAYYKSRSLDFLDVFAGCKNKLVEMLLKNTAFKHSELFNSILGTALDNNAGKAKNEALHNVCKKHSGALDELYIEMLGLEIYKK